MGTRILQRGFVGGEIAPSLFARTDLPHYKMGAMKLDNFYVLAQGSIRSRNGFRYVGTPINPYKAVKLIPFRYSSTQTYCLEFGDYTMKVISEEGYVADPDDETQDLVVTTPYSAENLKHLDFSQNADIVTITSNIYPPYELRRYDNDDWRFVRVSLTSSVEAPVISAVTAQYASYMTDAEAKTKDKINVTYVVTAFDSDDKESLPSAQASGSGNYYITGAKIRCSWGAVTGAVRYRLYRNVSGIFGYVGETENLYIDDEGLTPDTTITPPKYKDLFEDTSNEISAIEVATAGTGYHYAQFNLLYYLPRSLYIDAIQPFVSSAGESAEDVASWELINPRIDFYNDNTSLVEMTYPVNVSYVTVEIEGSYYKCAYLTTPTNIVITSSKQAMGTPRIQFNCDNESATKTYLGIEQQPTSKQSNTYFNQLDSGLTLAQYLQAFPQDTTVQFPLTITDTVGVNADVDVVAVAGAITDVIITNKGLNYTNATTATITSSVGSGATFTVTTSGDSIPDYPSACTQYDQRRVFAGSTPHPLKCWFTNAGQQDLMSYHIPILDDDRIEIDAVIADADRIKHIVALESLLLFTSTSELRVFTQNSDALTPKSVAVRPQSYVGANDVQPVVVNSTVVYASARGGHVRALGYDYNQQGYITQDISIRAPHLFDKYDIVSIALQKAPVQIIWAVSSNGTLLSCTFFPDQNLIAWAQHHTVNGLFEDIAVISEGEEDHAYAVINRNGVRRIERLNDMTIPDNANDYRYLDSYLDAVFDSPVTNLNGLEHLEGQEVKVYVDGREGGTYTVSEGAIILDESDYGCNIAVGLPISSTLITLPLVAEAEAELQGFTKNITEVRFRLSHDGNIKVGNYPEGDLFPVKKDDIFMQPHVDDSYIVKCSLNGAWNEEGLIKAVHTDAKPLEIQSIIYNMNFEGGK